MIQCSPFTKMRYFLIFDAQKLLHIVTIQSLKKYQYPQDDVNNVIRPLYITTSQQTEG